MVSKSKEVKAIIFGINGQDGYYLTTICKSKNIEVIGVSRSKGDWIKGNVADFSFVSKLVEQYQPDYIFHLAANSTTRHHALFENHEAISTGTLNILESVKIYKPSCRVFLTGSGVQFVNQLQPISESDAFNASSSYAVARIQSVYAARYYRSLGIKCFVGYLFHHESPHRKASHLCKQIADTVNRIASGSVEKIVIGDRTVRKEWAYAEDIATAIFILVQQDEIFEATIGTGNAYSVQDWIEACCKYRNLNWQEYVEDPEQLFSAEYKLLVSDNTTIVRLGWKPNTSFLELVKIMMEN